LGPGQQVPALVLIGGVGLLGMAAGGGPLLEICGPTTPEQPGGAGVLIELQHRGHDPVEEGAVVGDDHHAAPAQHVGLEALQPVEVQVVGGLVEQDQVEAGQQHGGQRHPGRLAAGQRRRRKAQEPGRQPEVGGHGVDAGVDVRRAQGGPPGQGGGVAVPGGHRLLLVSGGSARHGVGGRLQLDVGGVDPGAAPEPGRDGLDRVPLRLLGQVAHRGLGGSQLDRAGVGAVEAGQDAQQGGLAHPVGPDHSDAGLGANGHRDVGQHHLGALLPAQSPGGQHGIGGDDRLGHGRCLAERPARAVRISM
jgi:hypothetical protein